MIFLRPIILRDAATEAAISNEKYNFLRAEQLEMRSNRELKYRELQPVLPPLESQPPVIRSQDREGADLMQNPPPPPPERAPVAGDGFEARGD
jgi:general secretion pathway protein D